MAEKPKVAEVHLIDPDGMKRQGKPTGDMAVISMDLSGFSSLEKGHHFDFPIPEGGWKEAVIEWTYDRHRDGSLAIYAVPFG